MNRYSTKIWVMRGLMGFLFHKAMFPLAEMLQADKWDTTMTSWQPMYTSGIFSQAKSIYKKNSSMQFVIIGHSLGGNSCTYLSQQFASAGIPIAYLAVVDAPMPVSIGKTTKVCDNFFQFKKTFVDPRDPILKAQSPETKLTQYNFRAKNDGVGIYVEPENHISLGDNSFLMRRVVQQIQSL